MPKVLSKNQIAYLEAEAIYVWLQAEAKQALGIGNGGEAATRTRKKRGHYSGFEATPIEKMVLLRYAQNNDESGTRFTFKRAFSLMVKKAGELLVTAGLVSDYSEAGLWASLDSDSRTELIKCFPADVWTPPTI